MGVGDFSIVTTVRSAREARTAPGRRYTSLEAYLGAVQNPKQQAERVSIEEFDVLDVRNDPAEDATDRPWAVTSGILFAQLSVLRDVLVVNDPANLANAVNKTIFQHFPEAVRPRTLISRDHDEITEFVQELGAAAVSSRCRGPEAQTCSWSRATRRQTSTR